MKEIKSIVTGAVKGAPMQAFSSVYMVNKYSNIRRWFIAIIIFLLIILFLPWTQNIRARGYITTLKQEERPQELNAIIPGRIVKWYVREGDWVQKGDTIVQLAEIKDDYLDPALIQRTGEQLEAKKSAVDFYGSKVNAADMQIGALQQALELKLQQLKMIVVRDSIEAGAAKNAFEIAGEQYRRQLIMYDSGLVSKVQLEQRNQQYQNALAAKMSAEIKYANSKVELKQTEREYAEKIYKAQSEKAAAQSEIASGLGDVAKLENQYVNYVIRSGQYYLRASQDGQVVKASKSGINEIIKEGEKLVEIVPDSSQPAVELYVRPLDMPLLAVGQKVRFIFDGFPAIVFSGWPQASYGTFGGEVAAIESSVSANGKFRVLVKETEGEKKWPPGLRYGTGASSIMLLKDVPVWYEIWRNINGFPPDYYAGQQENEDKGKVKQEKK